LGFAAMQAFYAHPVAPKAGATRVGQPRFQTGKGWASPHTSASGKPFVWYGVTADPLGALEHWQGENKPNDNWADFGWGIRLTMAAFMQANPTLAAKKGLTETTFDAEANQRISTYVNNFYRMSGNVMSVDPLQQDAARQCALGNPAACGGGPDQIPYVDLRRY
jgi:hypothetical protein